MKKYKTIYILCILFLCSLIGACRLNSNAQELDITIGDQSIELKKIAETAPAWEKLFCSLMEETDMKELPVFNIGDSGNIKLPETWKYVELQECLLRPDGTMKYSETEIKTIVKTDAKNVINFEINENMSQYLSSNSLDYEQGNTLTGYLLTLYSDNSSEQYIFVIRT